MQRCLLYRRHCDQQEAPKKHQKPLLAFISEGAVTFDRSCHQRYSLKREVLKKFIKFTGKHISRNRFLIKLQAWSATFLKYRLRYRCFPVSFVKFLKTSFLQNTTGQLLLTPICSKISKCGYINIYCRKCNMVSWHKVIVVITGRTHCFHDCIYICIYIQIIKPIWCSRHNVLLYAIIS